MAFTDILDVQVSLSAPTVSAANFGVALILGASGRFTVDTANIYSSLAGMAADGFLTSDPEYPAAAALLSQVNRPAFFLVGQMGSEVAQVDHITINTDTNGDVYTAIVNGTSCSFTSLGTGTTATATGLAAAIQAQAATTGVGATSSSAIVTLTAATPGNAFTDVLAGTGVSLMTLVNITPNYGVQEALSRMQTAGATWYETLLTSRASHDILNAAAWTESASPPHIFMGQTLESTSASTSVNPSGTDLANVLHHLGYRRTGLWWHGLSTEYLDAAISGRELPLDPGTENWALKHVAAVSADNLSDTYKANMIGPPGTPGGKFTNVYFPMLSGGANPITMRGTMVDGTWIDAIRFVDFLVNALQVAVANLYLSVEKVPEDETGLAMVASQVNGVLQTAQNAGKITSFTVTVPPISSISSGNRAARRLDPPITFQAQLSGAFNYGLVRGTVTE